MESKSLTIRNDGFVVSYDSEKINEKLPGILHSAAEAFKAKSYKTAAKYFKNALDSIDDEKKAGFTNIVILTKYMLCSCWLESDEATDLWEAVKILESLEITYGPIYGMLYYAIAKAYLKLYRFNKAAAVLQKGFAVFQAQDITFEEFYIPETNELIVESTRIGLLRALTKLKDQCANWRRSDAVCCLAECSNVEHNESADKNIFFRSPTFAGMVRVTCNNPTNICSMNFHIACWKAKKELLCSGRKMSDKEVLHTECFTPNCVDGKGDRFSIQRIEIFDDNAEIKATIERREEDLVKYAKALHHGKGAIKKQQQRAKLKSVSSEPRSPSVRIPRPPTTPKKILKAEQTEEDDDFIDEKALKLGIEKLMKQRLHNFGIRKEKIVSKRYCAMSDTTKNWKQIQWQPNLPMYGNEYMLTTANVLADPDFPKDNEEDRKKKSFVFSYFYELISNNGPIKLSVLEKIWNEVQQEIIGMDCEFILENNVDISDFLMQSLKFAIIGNYICTIDKITEAYESAKTDSIETCKILMDDEVDENLVLTSSEETISSNVVSEEKNDVSSLHKIVNGNVDTISNVSFLDKNLTNGTRGSLPSLIFESREPVIEKKNNNSEVRDDLAIGKFANEKKPVARPLKVDTIDSPNKQKEEKRSNSSESKREISIVESMRYNGTKNSTKFCHDRFHRHEPDLSPKHTINGTYTVSDIENSLKFTRSIYGSKKKLFPEIESANNCDNPVDLPKEDCDISTPSSNEPIESNSLEEQGKTTKIETNLSNGHIYSLKDEKIDLVTKWNAEVTHTLSQEFAKSRKENERLKLEIEELKKSYTDSRGKLLKKILHIQYAYNQSVIASKIIEMRTDFNLVSGVQQILFSATAQMLPINGIELINNIKIMEEVSKNQTAKFAALDKQLSANLESQNLQEIDLYQEDIPNFQRFDLLSMIKSAFGAYQIHYITEFQKLHPPFPLPVQPHPPQLLNNNYYLTNPTQNLRNFNPPAQPQFGYVITNQPTINMQQQVDVRSTSFPNPTRQNNVPQILEEMKNPSEIVEPNFSFPVAKIEPAKKIDHKPKIADPRQIPSTNSEQQFVEAIQTIKDLSMKFRTRDDENSTVSSVPEVGCTNDTTRAVEAKKKNHFVEQIYDDFSHANEKQIQTGKKTRHSLDKLMAKLRFHYKGILELDLLNSVERVRKNHNNSLSKLSMIQIIREADKYIISSQHKQLCGYEKNELNQSYVILNSHSACHDKRKRQNSVSSTSSVASMKKGETGPLRPKKQWDPVVAPNDNWIKLKEESECIICFETMANTESHTLQCKHTFHKVCIKDWYKYQTQNERVMGSCPMCRLNSTIDEEYPPLRGIKI